MAQIINTGINSGLFSASTTAFSAITDSLITADISGCKDPVTVVVDIPESAAGEFQFLCVPAEKGFGEIKISLTGGKLNVFRITTKGLKKPDGSGDFKLLTADGGSAAGKNIKIAFLKYASVLNN